MFIETHRLAQFNPRGTDVSVVLDLMIHDIDIVLHTVKSPVKKIYANGVAIVSNTPDIANARIEFANGCVCNLTASRISMKNMRKSRFFQGEAYISVDFLEKKCEIIKIQPTPADLNDPFAMVIDLPNEKGSRLISIEHPPIQEVNAIKHELTLFAHSINNNTTPAVSLADGVRVLETAQQIIDRLQSMNV
jgi:predicted dehydrogenase